MSACFGCLSQSVICEREWPDACLRAMRESGYGYAIIGGAGPMKFYEKAVGATIIPDSKPGIYTDMLKRGS